MERTFKKRRSDIGRRDCTGVESAADQFWDYERPRAGSEVGATDRAATVFGKDAGSWVPEPVAELLL